MKQHRVLFTSILGIVLLFGCKNDITPSLYDPNYSSPRPQPVVDSIAPAGSVLAATTPITIYGKNFSATPAENSIYFNGKKGTVQSATATQLVCVTTADSGAMLVKVGVAGADKYSNEFPYRLILAVEAFGNFTPPTNGAAGITPDSAGNIYFNLLASNVDNGVYIMSPTGTKTQYGNKLSGNINWASLKLGQDNLLYATRNVKAVYRFGVGGGNAAPWTSIPSGTLSDIDFDQNGYLWAGGNASSLYSIKPTKALKTSPFAASVHAVRVFDGRLYIAALKDSIEQIFSAPINGDTLGAITPYFNIKNALGSGYSGLSMTFSSDGYLYIATQAPEGIIIVAPGGASYSTPYKGYGANFGTSCVSLAWGAGEKLFVTTFEGNLLLLHTNKSSAPYYGVN